MQVLSTPILYLELVNLLARTEIETNPGERVDTFIMVYKDPEEVYKEWLKYDKREMPRGYLHIVLQETDGGCYEMYNNGFQMNKDDYEWFIFTPDDVFILGDGYRTEMDKRWTDNAGFIAMQGMNDSPHVQGSIGLTHRDILQQVCELNNGELPHPKGTFLQERNIAEGEIPFTHMIHNLGYDLIKFNDSEKWSMENYCMPYHNLKYKI